MGNYKPHVNQEVTIAGFKFVLSEFEQERLHLLYYPHVTVADPKSLFDYETAALFNSGPKDMWVLGGTIDNATNQNVMTLGHTNTIDNAGTIFHTFASVAGTSDFYVNKKLTSDKKYITSDPSLTATYNIKLWVVIIEA